MRRKTIISLGLVLVLLSLSFATVAADKQATVYVGHGIPGLALGFDDDALPVDVAVDGDCIPDVEFGKFAGPVLLPGGTYTVIVSLADATVSCDGTPVIEAAVEFEVDGNYTVFAHLTADGEPGEGDLDERGITATRFVNDVDPAVAGHTRLTVRHTAAAPAVDIELYRGWSRGRVVGLIEGLKNPEEAGPLDIRPGGYEAVIWPAADDANSPAGEDEVLLGLEVALKPHTSHIVYAVGITDALTVVTQVIDLGMVPPPRPMPPGPPSGPPSP